MKRFSIRQYVAWLTLTPLLILTISLEWFFLHEHLLDSERELMERSQLIASQLASGSEYGVFANNQPFLQNIAQDVLQQPDVQGVIILNADSEVLVKVGTFYGAPENAPENAAGIQVARITESVNLQVPVYRSQGGLRIYQPIVAAQVALDELDVRPEVKQTGAVIVEMSSAQIEQHKSHMLWLTVGSTALFLLFPFGLIYLGSRKITYPIRKLSDAIQALGDGRLETRVAISAPVTELATLTYGINDMAAKLQQEQEMLQQRTARLTDAQRIAHLGNWEWDIANNVMDWSDEMYRIFGLAPQAFKITYEAFLQAVHPEDRQFVNAEVHDALEQRHNYDIGYRILLPDGSLRHIHAQGEVNFDEDGQPLKMQGTVQDITETKLAEEAIRKQQELTIQIIETIPMRVFWKDRDLRYLGCNTLFAKDAGLSHADELIDKTDFEMSWKDQAELYRADDRLVMDSNTPKLSYDEPQTTPEGGRIWLRTSKVPLRNGNNKTIGVLGVYEDITKYKQMELQLLESEERFRKAFQYSAIGMALVGLDGRWLKVNDSLCQIVGYSEQELLSKTFQDITHPDDLQTDLGFVAQLLSGEKDHYQMEKRYLHKDGHVVWIRLSVSLIRDAQNTPIHLVAQIDDITEDKRAAQTLAESESRFREIFNTVNDVIFIHDAETGRILDVNRRLIEIYGFSREEVFACGPDDMSAGTPPYSSAEAFEKMRLARTEGPQTFDWLARARDGHLFWVEVSLRFALIGSQQRILAVARDISERKLAEEEIRQLNEKLETKVQERTIQLLDAQEELVRKEKLAVLGQVAGSVGHELRNPLGVMNNAVYFLQTVLSDADDSVKEYLGIIKGEIAASERIVSDLLDAVRTKPPHSGTVGITELIEQTLRKCNVPPSVSVKLDISATLPPLRVDAMQIHQVFRNLISNGVEAMMPDGGVLEISAVENRKDGTVTVSVRDSGTGITPEQLGKLFLPLFTTKARGIGLGLVVVKNLTEANGGTVKVASEAGKGATFFITLPSDSSTIESA